MKEIGIYVHIPFCKKKCAYCDFNSYAGKEDLIEKYIKWLNYEIREVGNANKINAQNGLEELVKVKTIYIGGGTPSVIEEKHIMNILTNIKESFNIDKDAEITIEINPGTCNERKLKEYYKSGINRLSIGLQVTNDELLKQIGRIHNYKDFLSTYNLARKIGFNNINIDLMIGLPNQTLDMLEETIEEVINLNPEHISVYSLIVEEGTKLEKDLQEGKYELPSDEYERRMYWMIKKKLQDRGYSHYEISNFAEDGLVSRHNMDCWEQKEYMGFGAGAHSYTDDVRYSNVEEVEEYIKNIENGRMQDNFIFHEKQNKISKMKEYMMLGLRKIDGVNCFEFKTKFREDPKKVFHDELTKLENLGLVDKAVNIKLTDKGIDLANIVWEEFV